MKKLSFYCKWISFIGGEKYIVHNILFKFAVDSSNLFGGSTWAASKVYIYR